MPLSGRRPTGPRRRGPGRAGRPARLRDRRRAATSGGPREVGRRARARAASGAWRPATACGSAAAGRLRDRRHRALARQRRLSRSPRPRASTSRERTIARDSGSRRSPNLALLWLDDPARADVTLAQARAVVVRPGQAALRHPRRASQVLIDQAAGIVIALLVAFALVALVAAGTMLARRRARGGPAARCRRSASSARSGFTPARVVARPGAPRRRSSRARGRPRRARGSARSPSRARRGRCWPRSTSSRRAGALLAAAGARLARGRRARRRAAATWPAWRAARRPPARAAARRRAARRAAAPGAGGRRAAGLLAGARRAGWSPARGAARGAWPARGRRDDRASAPAVVLLMLALASLLVRLRDDPGDASASATQLTVHAGAGPAARDRGDPRRRRRRRSATRSTPPTRSGSASRCGSSPTRGDHTRFEAPPLADGPADRGPTARRRSGTGSPTRSGCGRARTLAVAAPERRGAALAGRRHRPRARARRPPRLGARGHAARRRAPGSQPGVVVRLEPGADRAAVDRGAARRSARAPRRGRRRDAPATPAFLGVARRRCCAAVALAVGLVCLYALVQALAMTARERRGAVAAAARAAAAGARDGRAGARRRRGRGRASRPRSPASLLESARARPARGAARRRLRRAPARARRPQARRGRALGLLASSPRSPPRSSPAACCASRSSPGCGRSDRARRSRSPCSAAVVARRLRRRRASGAAGARPAARRCARTLADPDGDGALERGAGRAARRPQRPRRGGRPGRVIATLRRRSPTPTCATRSRPPRVAVPRPARRAVRARPSARRRR